LTRRRLLAVAAASVILLTAGCGQRGSSWGELGTLECTNTRDNRWLCHAYADINETGERFLYSCQTLTHDQIDFNLDCSNVTEQIEKNR
jgi:hypothetical protein